MAFNRLLFYRLYIYIDFILSALYRHFDGFTARNLSAPFQPFHALNECDGVRHLATMEREPHHTPPPKRERNHTPPREQRTSDNQTRQRPRTAKHKFYTFVNLFTILQGRKNAVIFLLIIYIYFTTIILLYIIFLLNYCTIILYSNLF